MKLTPKGMRDIAPEDMYLREDVISRIRDIFRLYGYRPLETPALEYMETLKAKAGEDVSRQIFVIGEGEYGLRFDLTVPLARYASAAMELPKPFKRYAIDAVWRKEEPQRGRFREFYQCDADIVGSASMRCEAELLALGVAVCREFGFEKPKILLNNRKILDAMADSLGIGKKRDEIFRILDKLDKVGEAEVERLLRESLGNKADAFLSIIRSGSTNEEKLAIAQKYSEDGASELRQIIGLCPFEITIDLFLVRGLGYYTGPTYEIKLSGDMGTVLGGGRYDGLLGIYGAEAPATGISVGLERLITLIAERSAEGRRKTSTRVLVASVKPDFYAYASEIASKLRAAGIAAECDLNERNLRKQFDYANALSIPYVAVVGQKEMESEGITLKDMGSGKEESLTLKDALKRLKV